MARDQFLVGVDGLVVLLQVVGQNVARRPPGGGTKFAGRIEGQQAPPGEKGGSLLVAFFGQLGQPGLHSVAGEIRKTRLEPPDFPLDRIVEGIARGVDEAFQKLGQPLGRRGEVRGADQFVERSAELAGHFFSTSP